MTCRHLEALAAGVAGETAFTIDASRVTFGRGALSEVGERSRALGITRAALITDRNLHALPWFAEVDHALRTAGIEVAVFDDVAIEPTEASLADAIAFARDAKPDGYVSLGGGSVIVTCKLANLYATHPAELRSYVNAPVGDARPVPGPLAPHVACPTTSGTGSEVTGIAIFDWVALGAKTGVASPRLRPSEALVDPRTTRTLPSAVVAASGMDVVCHAIESLTARPFATRARTSPVARPMSQGANRWSDLGCREALRIANTFLVRAVRDAGDDQAREEMMWAATLAGIAFGNAGVHVPHAMAYAIAGGAPELVPHGLAVALGAPAVFRAIAAFVPERCAEAARLLASERHDREVPADALAQAFATLAGAVGVPAGLAAVGYGAHDVPRLVAGTLPQQRLLANAPCVVDAEALHALFAESL